MLSTRSFAFCSVAALLLSSHVLASADEDAVRARAVAEKYGRAVITVEIVLEESYDYGGGGEKRESKMTSSAVFVDPSGLAVASLSSIDPTSTRNQISSEGGSKASSKIVEAKLRAEDGTEILADIVLRDRDLDLAVLRPKSPPATPLPFVNMSQPNPDVKMFDELVTLRRLGRVAGRTLGGCGDMVKAVATKPRLFYVVYGSCGLGLPAFTLDGKVAGISVLRTYGKMDMDDASWFSNEMAYVVLPPETVRKIIDQAKKTGKTTATPVAKPAVKPSAKPK